MVTSPGASSSLDHPGVHNASRSVQQLPNDPSGRSSMAQSVSRNAQATPQPQTSGPSVVSRYMLPTYRQASSGRPEVSSSLSQLNTSSNPAIHPLNASLPDILHAHLVPQIPRLRQNQRRHGDQRHTRERHRSETDGSRHRHTHHGRSERRRTQSSSSHTRDSCACKEPCVKCVVTFTSFRWVLVVLSILGVCCVVSGVVLAALHAAGSSFLFLAIMFIGLGILLVIVVSVGWKCTPRGHEPLHALFHIGQFGRGGTRERHRRRRHRHRDGNWFGGVMYPEFQYRRPPPSYAASMQDYHNQSLQELSSAGPPNPTPTHGSVPGSPPPSYHSRTSTMHSGITIIGHDSNSQPNSRPPTYRSRAPSRRPSLPRQHSREGDEATGNSPLPSHNPELSLEDFSQVVTSGNTLESNGSGGNIASTSELASATVVVVSNSPTAVHLHEIELTSQPVEDSSDHPDSPQNHAVPFAMGSTDADLTVISHGTEINNQNGQNREMDITVVTDQPSSMSFIPGLPSARENYESDAQQLERALRPLEMMDEYGGIDNPGANISSSDLEHYDTHL